MKRKYLILTTVLLCLITISFAQTIEIENFNNPNVITLTGTPTSSWRTSTLNTSAPYSYRGMVPKKMGEYIVLETPAYDITDMSYIVMRFKHICKISPQDVLRIEYQENINAWKPIPASAYEGEAYNYNLYNFSASSYDDWQQDDSLSIPDNSWWKEELFDLSHVVVGATSVKFRFILERGMTLGTNVAYGWLIDDFEVITNSYILKNPIVNLMKAPQDTVYSVGPWEIKADIQPDAGYALQNPVLSYTAKDVSLTTIDSAIIFMTNVSGNIWTATIPAFPIGSRVAYTIEAEDINTNKTIVPLWYYMDRYTGEAGVTMDYVYFSAEDTAKSYGSDVLSNMSDITGWSRHLYLNSELQGIDPLTPTVITDIAYYSQHTNIPVKSDIRIYLEATQAKLNEPEDWVDPATTNAQLVYQGPYTGTLLWNEFEFQEAFILPAGHNLLVYFVDSSGVASVYKQFNCTDNRNGMYLESLKWGDIIKGLMPVTRFGIGETGIYGDYSVGLASIVSPVKGSIDLQNPNPIVVNIHNKGTIDLDSVTIHWQINSGTVHSKVWKGNLPWDYKEAVTLGNYSVETDIDTLKVWLFNQSGLLVDDVLFDDTLTSLLYNCIPVTGRQEVGSNSLFKSVEELLEEYIECGYGDLIVALEADEHDMNISLSNISRVMNGHTLTITSATGKAEDAIIKPSYGVGITLNNAENVVIKDISVDISQRSGTEPAIEFAGACKNILIRDCRILGDTISGSGTALIYKSNDGGIVDSIFIINNFINGNPRGIWFYAGSATTYMSGNNIICDSNTVSNASYYGICFVNANLISCSYNTVLTRAQNALTGLDGFPFRMENVTGNIIGNRIIQRSTASTQPYGMWFKNYHTNLPSNDTGLIANNEIVVYTSGAYQGMYIENANANIINNSIYVGGATGESRGVYLTDFDGYVNIQNNNIVTNSINSYPIYLAGTTYLNQWNINNNNLYAPLNIGYAVSPHTSLDSWQSVVTTDRNSRRVFPQFIDAQTDLKHNLRLSYYADLLCNRASLVDVDINGKERKEITTIGCYEEILGTGSNAMFVEIIGLREGNVAGQTDNVQLVIFNSGATTINTLNIEWSVNGISYPAGGKSFNVSLLPNQYDTIDLGVVNYTAGTMNVKAWINNSYDDIVNDDTLAVSTFICGGAFNGTIVISDTSTYKTVTEALEKLHLCGVTGDVIFVLDNGVYEETVDLGFLSLYSGNYSLTITSKTGNAQDAVIRPSSRAGILLNSSNNIMIKDITIDVREVMIPAIRFIGACTNVLVRDCRLLGNLSATGNTTADNTLILKSDATGVVDSIFIINNLFDGGYRGLQFYGGTSAAYGTNFLFDSNTVSNWYSTGIYPSYVDLISCSHNTIVSRKANTTTTNYFLRTNYVNGPIFGNRIIQCTTAITMPYGIYLSNYNYYNTTKKGLVANNELILNTTSSYYGIYIAASTNANIIHNSIYMGGSSGTGRGIHVASSANTNIEVRNNNIVTKGTYSYPIYLASLNYLSQWKFGYNNMCGGSYVGYAGGARATIDLWQQYVTSDEHSFKANPNFLTEPNIADSAQSLAISYDDSFLCPLYDNIITDIDNNSRINSSNQTIAGAYMANLPTLDLALNDVILTGIVSINQEYPVYIEAQNLGLNNITSAQLGWSIDENEQQVCDWTVSTALEPYDKVKIMLGSFPATLGDTFDIKVWINTVNGNIEGGNTDNDTISFTVVPALFDLVRFDAPFVSDTINTLSFDVYAQIIEETGATVNTPKMKIQTIAKNGDIFYDTIPMNYVNGLWKWVANIPQQYYDSKIIYSLTLSDTIGNEKTIADSTYIYKEGAELYNRNNLTLYSIQRFASETELCARDYESVIITLANTGSEDYDFAQIPVTFTVDVTTPRPFSHTMILNTGGLSAGNSRNITITSMLPTANAGQYDVKVWLSSPSDKVSYDDTLTYDYVSEKFGLPIEASLDTEIHHAFYLENNTNNEWTVVSSDGTVIPHEGNGMLMFTGSQGSISSLYTWQLDLSRSISPTLSFWYYHDNTPCDDYTEVRLTVDGGTTDTTLLSLVKYDANHSGWKYYKIDLPTFAVNQCVILYFEAMMMSPIGSNVAQYLDHILITATQEIAITEILTSELSSACDLKNKELKVVLSNLTAPNLDYSTTNLEITLEFNGASSQSFTVTKNTGILEGFSSDTITVTTDFDFTKGEYFARAYISSLFGDIFMDTIEIEPAFTIAIETISDNTDENRTTAGFKNNQHIILENTGNMDLPDIDLTLIVSSDKQDGEEYYFEVTQSSGRNLPVGDTIHIHFDSAYTAPMSSNYSVTVYGHLSCDSAIATANDSKLEYVYMDDLALKEIVTPEDNPNTIDVVGSKIGVSIKVENLNSATEYDPGTVKVRYKITDLDGNQEYILPTSEDIDEKIIAGMPVTHSFGTEYSVPNLPEYYLVVYIEEMDKYNQNDTIRIRRKTDYDVSISTVNKVSFTLEQNIPNPAKEKTVIHYNIPQDGEVQFQVYSVNGQLLYSQKENARFGDNRIELNISDYASGIYFYTMEYKGQRISKRMSITR